MIQINFENTKSQSTLSSYTLKTPLLCIGIQGDKNDELLTTGESCGK